MYYLVRNKTTKQEIRRSSTPISTTGTVIGLDPNVEILQVIEDAIPAHDLTTQKVTPTTTELNGVITHSYTVSNLTAQEKDTRDDNATEWNWTDSKQTTTGTATVLKAFRIPTGGAINVSAFVAGTKVTTPKTIDLTTAFKLEAVVKNIGGTAYLVGTVDKKVFGDNTVGMDASIVVFEDKVRIGIKGVAATDINWEGTGTVVSSRYRKFI